MDSHAAVQMDTSQLVLHAKISTSVCNRAFAARALATMSLAASNVSAQEDSNMTRERKHVSILTRNQNQVQTQVQEQTVSPRVDALSSNVDVQLGSTHTPCSLVRFSALT